MAKRLKAVTSKRPTTRRARRCETFDRQDRKRRAAEFMQLLELCGLVPKRSTNSAAPSNLLHIQREAQRLK